MLVLVGVILIISFLVRSTLGGVELKQPLQ